METYDLGYADQYTCPRTLCQKLIIWRSRLCSESIQVVGVRDSSANQIYYLDTIVTIVLRVMPSVNFARGIRCWVYFLYPWLYPWLDHFCGSLAGWSALKAQWCLKCLGKSEFLWSCAKLQLENNCSSPQDFREIRSSSANNSFPLEKDPLLCH